MNAAFLNRIIKIIPSFKHTESSASEEGRPIPLFMATQRRKKKD